VLREKFGAAGDRKWDHIAATANLDTPAASNHASRGLLWSTRGNWLTAEHAENFGKKQLELLCVLVELGGESTYA
jgi:hypothetical protein